MTELELEAIKNIDEINAKIISPQDLKPFLRDRTLLYGYTCAREDFHVYIKDTQIHVVVYKNDYSKDFVKPKEMREIQVTSNYDYVPDKRLYPEACDYLFCKLLKKRSIPLLFTYFDDKRVTQGFYGFTLEDCQ